MPSHQMLAREAGVFALFTSVSPSSCLCAVGVDSLSRCLQMCVELSQVDQVGDGNHLSS